MTKNKKWQVVTVRMPLELHAQLVDEAWARKTSLNELRVLRLACEPLPERCVSEEEVKD
jgi:predicted HicB family RNase H-like nuclease